MQLIQAADGYQRNDVFLEHGTIHKTSDESTRSVHAVLNHLAKAGFPAPRVIGSGFDDVGMQTLSYVDGHIAERGPWSNAALTALGTMLRRIHEVMKEFVPPDGAVWYPWCGRDLGARTKLVSHCDLGPWNIVTKDGAPNALIDWDFAGPVDPVVELAQLCWLNVKLYDSVVSKIESLSPFEERAKQLRLIVDAYGLNRSERGSLVQLMIDLATLEAAAQSDDHALLPDTPLTGVPQQLPWAITWRARSAATMIRNRRMLEEALL